MAQFPCRVWRAAGHRGRRGSRRRLSAGAHNWNPAPPGRVTKLTMRPLTLLILAAASGWSAEDGSGIIKRLAEAQKQNDSVAGEYTYVQEAVFFTRSEEHTS